MAVLHAFDCLLVSSVESALYSGDNCEAFFIGFVGNFEHFAALYRVDARGFFDKQVFAGLHKFPDVERAENGRGGVDYNVAVFAEDLLVGVPA